MIDCNKWGEIIWGEGGREAVKEFINGSLEQYKEGKRNFTKRIEWRRAYYNKEDGKLRIKVNMSWDEDNTELPFGKIWGWQNKPAYFTIPIGELQKHVREMKLKKIGL